MTLLNLPSPPARVEKAARVAAICITLMLIPALAFAIPGSGDMTSLDTASGREIAGLYNIIAKICLVVFIIVAAVLFGSIVLFRRRSDDEMPKQVHGNAQLEIFLLVAATVVQIFIGWKSIDVMWKVEKIPPTVMTITAVGYQWGWEFHYKVPDPEDPKKTKVVVHEDLVFPAYKNIKLHVTSKDVLHSLFIPELGVKMDAVPGRFNHWWFNADGPINQVIGTQDTVPVKRPVQKTTRSKSWVRLLNVLTFHEYEDPRYAPRSARESKVTYMAKSREADDAYAKYKAFEYRGMCTELCGSGHYNMYFRAVAMTQSSFDQWLVDKQSGAGAKVDGAALFKGKCASCHGDNGEGKSGPPLAGSDWASEDSDKSRARHIKVVLAGLTGKISLKVNGKPMTWNSAMPQFHQQLNDDQVAALVNHERTSWGNKGGTVTPDMVKAARKSAGFRAFGAGGVTPTPENELMSLGAKVYTACASCHGADGKGESPLASSAAIKGDVPGLVSVLDGKSGKHAPMGLNMSDRQMAALLTYVRKSFASAAVVQPADVTRARKNK